MNRTPPTEHSETMRMPSRVLTEPHITDSSGSIDFDEPARIQHQDAMFQTIRTRTRVLTDEEIDSFTDSSGRIDLDAMLLSWQNDPAPVAFPPQPQLTQEEINSRIRTRIPVLTDEEIDSFTDSSGRIDLDAMLLSTQNDPARYQPQDDINPPRQPETTSPVAFPPQPQLTPEEINSRIRTRIPVLTDEEIDSFTDSSGRIDLDAMLLSWQNDPAPVAFPPQPQLTQEEINSRIRTRIPVLTDEEIDSFTDSSGRIDLDAMLLSTQNDPARYQPQDDINPPRQPETMSHEAYILGSQSKGLSKGTISKYLKTMSADEIRDQDKDGDRKICAVCLDDMCGQKDKVAILDKCGHEFHYCCLEKWLRRKNICPLCRRTAIYLLQDR